MSEITDRWKVRICRESDGNDPAEPWQLDCYHPATRDYSDEVSYFATFEEAVAAIPGFIREVGAPW